MILPLGFYLIVLVKNPHFLNYSHVLLKKLKNSFGFLSWNIEFGVWFFMRVIWFLYGFDVLVFSLIINQFNFV